MDASEQLKFGSEEDNLIAIYRSCCFGWLSEKFIGRVMLFQFLTVQWILVLAYIEFSNNVTFHANRKFYPFLILLEMGSFMYLVGLAECSNIRRTSEIIETHTWSWTLAGNKIYRKLLSEGRHLKVMCFAIVCLTSTSAVFLTVPALGDEKQWQLIPFIWNKYFDDQMHIILLIIEVIEAAAIGIVLSSLICYSLYCIGHIWVQYQLLNAFVCRLHTRSIYHMNDIRYQERVTVLLICCIKMHTEIIKLKTILMRRANSLVLSFTTYGLTIFVFSAYFIIMDLSPRSNFRMYTAILTGCLILWVFCEYCQRVTNESEKVFLNACKCPWEQFNNHNRKIFLMLLSNSINPVTVSCHGVLDANYPLAVKMWRMAYAAHTLFTNMSRVGS